MSHHGTPVWYELASPDLAASEKFYADLLGWNWQDSGMEGMTYKLATSAGAMVAGLFSSEMGRPPGWLIYFAVDSADESAALAQGAGATEQMPPTDIPGTGRFALLADPQGASFGILQPLPMPDGSGGGSFDPEGLGCGQWNELATSDAEAALGFYARIFGWTVSRAMPMGPDVTYSILASGATDIGGVFKAEAAAPCWKPYFGVASAETAKAKVAALGGTVTSGPDQVPNGVYTLQCKDPGGVGFALVGPL